MLPNNTHAISFVEESLTKFRSKCLNQNPKAMNALFARPLCNFYPNFRPKPITRGDLRPPSCTSSLKIGEETKLKWTNLKRDLTAEETIAISLLPPKMANRCKALLKRLICFSCQNENLQFLLAAWVKTMKPRRADWLAVLKEMKRIEHPLYIEVSCFLMSYLYYMVIN